MDSIQQFHWRYVQFGKSPWMYRQELTFWQSIRLLRKFSGRNMRKSLQSLLVQKVFRRPQKAFNFTNLEPRSSVFARVCQYTKRCMHWNRNTLDQTLHLEGLIRALWSNGRAKYVIVNESDYISQVCLYSTEFRPFRFSSCLVTSWLSRRGKQKLFYT